MMFESISNIVLCNHPSFSLLFQLGFSSCWQPSPVCQFTFDVSTSANSAIHLSKYSAVLTELIPQMLHSNVILWLFLI